MVNPTINLISRTYHLCERSEYAFIILREYTIISLVGNNNTGIYSTSIAFLPIYVCARVGGLGG